MPPALLRTGGIVASGSSLNRVRFCLRQLQHKVEQDEALYARAERDRVRYQAFNGTVYNLPGAAGSLFSLLPAENVSGNFVNVIQRLPVRIRFNAGQDTEHVLRPGWSRR